MSILRSCTDHGGETTPADYQRISQDVNFDHRCLQSQGVIFGFWTLQARFDQVNFDDYCAEILDVTCQETNCLTTSDWLEKIHPEDAGAVQDALHRCLTGMESVFCYLCRIKKAEGQYAWVLDRGYHQDRTFLEPTITLTGLRVLLLAPPHSAKQLSI